MEYIFGTRRDIEVLKTKGDAHSQLSGYHEVTREYPDQVIVDRFRVVRKIDSKEDIEGNMYDWYEIDRHYRMSDKSEQVSKVAEERSSELEEALVEVADMVANLEDALVEIAEIVEGSAE